MTAEELQTKSRNWVIEETELFVMLAGGHRGFAGLLVYLEEDALTINVEGILVSQQDIRIPCEDIETISDGLPEGVVN